MFVHNQTLPWLQAKSSKEKAALFAKSRKAVRKARNSFKERQTQIHEARRAAITAKMKAAEEMKARSLQRKQKLTDDIVHWGLWQSEETINSCIRVLTNKKDKVAALKAQLNFRKDVLQQASAGNTSKEIYSFSKKKMKVDKVLC